MKSRPNLKFLLCFNFPIAVCFTVRSQTVSDYDGNVYETIIIGNQTWMAENLKTTKYNNGTSIPLVTENSAWMNHTTPGYCWYNNDSAEYSNSYGALYNWYSVNTQILCPIGWHVPSNEEWIILENYLGGIYEAGGKMKETGTNLWDYPNVGATNESGFTGRPGGARLSDDGEFHAIGFYGIWWTRTAGDEIPFPSSYCKYLIHDIIALSTNTYNRKNGYSVRCIKDSQTSATSNLIDTKNSEIYPNPCSDYFYITSNDRKIQSIQIFSGEGKLIRSIDTKSEDIISVTDIDKGLYIVVISTVNNFFLYKLIIE